MAPLESGFATFQSSSEQREKCSHCTYIDERKHESGLFRLQTGPQMKWNLSAIQLSVTRNPVAWGTVTEHLPCLSDSVFDVVICASGLSSPSACKVSVCTSRPASRPRSGRIRRVDLPRNEEARRRPSSRHLSGNHAPQHARTFHSTVERAHCPSAMDCRSREHQRLTGEINESAE